MLGGPIGALVGVWLGSLLETTALPSGNGNSDAEDANRRSGYRRPSQGDIRVSILVLIACVMKADGHVKRSELDAVKRFLLRNYGEEGGREALQLLRQLLDRHIDHIAVADQIRHNVNYSTRLEILHFLLDIAFADGEYEREEQNMIEQLVGALYVSDADYRSLLALYGLGKDPNWAYTMLEISSSATNDEVKKAYRRMAMKYHPDKVASAGEDVKKKATEKFRGIQEAYETIKKQRGIS